MGVLDSYLPFLPVYIVRLGGTPLDVGMVSVLPAAVGAVLAIPFGHFLRRRARIVPWYSRSRLASHQTFWLIALVAVAAPPESAVIATLGIWLIASIPATLGTVAFPIVMDGAAGRRGRYALMGRRWAIMGISGAVTVGVAGSLLEVVPFPANYSLLFAVFATAGIVAFNFSRQYRVPPERSGLDPVATIAADRPMYEALNKNRAFLWFCLRQIVFLFGLRMILPIVPLFYIKDLGASDLWIGAIAMCQAISLVAGYRAWPVLQARSGRHRVLLVSLFVGAATPAILALAPQVAVVPAIAALGAFGAAGIDLALFDELMRRVPAADRIRLVSVNIVLTNCAFVVAPLVGAWLALALSLTQVLQVGSVMATVGAIMFAVDVMRGADGRNQVAGT